MADTQLFNRQVRVIVDTIDINGLDCQFTIKKNLKPDPNTCDLKIWNLNKSHRSALEEMKAASVYIEAGYESGMSVLFVGDLRTSMSITEGPDIITSLSSGDGEKAIRKSRVNVSIKKDTKTADVLRIIAQALGVGEGNLSSAVSRLQSSGIADLFSEGTVLTGSAAREMTQICHAAGLDWSIQDGKLQILPLRTSLSGTAIELSSSSGLIGAPTIDNDGVLSARMLLIPDVFPGRKIVLNSVRLKGQYRIEECTYTGDTAGQDWYTDIKAKRY